MAKEQTSFMRRLIGRSEPLEHAGLSEIFVTIFWWCTVAALVILFWPSHGAFVYEGF